MVRILDFFSSPSWKLIPVPYLPSPSPHLQCCSKLSGQPSFPNNIENGGRGKGVFFANWKSTCEKIQNSHNILATSVWVIFTFWLFLKLPTKKSRERNDFIFCTDSRLSPNLSFDMNYSSHKPFWGGEPDARTQRVKQPILPISCILWENSLL